MTLGRHLRELSRHPVGLAVSVLLALLAVALSTGRISLAPPGIESKRLETAAASTRVLVDSPRSSVLDLSVQTNDFKAITNRALLIGNVMASGPVRDFISRRARIPADRIEISSPVTPDFPRELTPAGGGRRTTDVARSPDEYRIRIRSNPTVPILDVFAQASTAGDAERLADGAVAGLRDYLRELAVTQRVPPRQQVTIEQLGAAKGGVINPGVSVEVAALSFVLVLAACCASVLFLGRVRRGWRLDAAVSTGSEPA